MVYSQTRSPKGFMEYSKGTCDECDTVFIGRFRHNLHLEWERCPTPGCVSGFPMLKATWDEYVEAMESNARLLYDE